MDTIEKAAEAYQVTMREVDVDRVYDTIDVDSIRYVAFKAGANWQKEQSPWINVEERLPGIDELVLCQMESNYAIVSGYIFINEAGNPQVATDPSFEFEDYNDYKPTKWMPISE